MHICVIGDGVAGLMAANLFAVRDYVTKVTHIESSKIPSIGVGESTTLNFSSLHGTFISNEREFVRESNACVKVGVLYSNWSRREFIHHFRDSKLYQKNHTTPIEYANSLANKDPDIHIHDLLASKLYKDAKQYKIPYPINNPNFPNCFYGTSWHFDAGKYISYLKKILRRNEQKVEIIDAIVVDCNFREDDSIESIILDSGQQIIADYYVIAIGKSKVSSDVFKVKYKDLSNVLLTNKALFYPKPYENKEKEIHPYTIAKTMKNGWRWITPTWSRVGTGYVFSENHISVEDAIKEFQEDIGDDTISPNVVDFHPRYNPSTFNNNYITLGMSNGFLEPLDAPGLAISSAIIMMLDTFMNMPKFVNDIKNKKYNSLNNSWLNEFVELLYNGWTAFILSQYKTCHRTDTQFWNDHKNVEFEYLYELVQNLNNDMTSLKYYGSDDPTQIVNAIRRDIITMMQQTIASKDIRWISNNNMIPFKLNDDDHHSVDHYEFLKSIYND